MADRRDYYFRQKVTEGELDDGFDGLERADRAIMADQLLTGVFKSDGVEEHTPQNMTVDVLENVAYDDQGQRIDVPATQNVDLSVDWLGSPTAVSSSGNEKWISIFIEFQRSLSDPRLDGNNDTVFFERNESFAFKVVQGAESIPDAVRPSLESGRVLIADVKLTYGMTAIPNASIDLSRRQTPWSASGTNLMFNSLNVDEFVEQLVGLLDEHIDGSDYQHNGASIGFSTGATWFDGSSLASLTVEDAIDEIVTTLGASTGSDKIGQGGTSINPTWDIPPSSLQIALSNLAANIGTLDSFLQSVSSGSDGASYVGAAANGGIPAGSVESQLSVLDQANVASKVFWVNADAASSGSGSQHDPFNEINSAIVAAADIDGALIMVAPGTYSGLDNSAGHSNYSWRIVAYGPTRSTFVSGDGQIIYRGTTFARRFLFDGLSIVPVTGVQALAFSGTSGDTYVELANCYLYNMVVSRDLTGTDEMRVYAHSKETADLVRAGSTSADYLFGGVSGTPSAISLTLRNIAMRLSSQIQLKHLFAENMVMLSGPSQDINIWHEAAGVQGALSLTNSRLGSGTIARTGSTDLLQGYWDSVTNYWRHADGLTVTDIQPNIMHNETV